jgi:mono/diheme cytochrome c family protein
MMASAENDKVKENEVSNRSRFLATWRLGPIVLALILGAVAPRTASSQSQHTVSPPPKVVVTDYDMGKAAAASRLSPAELSGKKLFVQRCALCHDLLGQPATTTVAPWVDVETVKARGEEAIRMKITNGSRMMPAWKYALEPQQIESVIAYLKTVTPDQKPKPGGPVTGPIE